MSKIDDLINKLCPNGVKFFELGEIATFSQGIQVAVNEQKYEKQDGFIRFLRIIDYTDNNEPPRYIKKPDDKYIKKDNELIMIRYGTPGKVCIDYEGAIANNMFKINFNIDEINTKYMYYYLSQNSIYSKLSTSVKSTMPSINFGIVSKIIVAVPPLEVQDEIVHILDDFTLLSAELSAELKARREQFSYYREELISKSNGTKYKLDDVVEIYLGLTHTPKYVENGIKFISAQNTSNDYLDLDNVKYISRQEFDSITDNAKPKKDDVLFTRVGSNLGHPVIVETDEELCIFVSLGFLRVKDKTILSNKYLKHWINTEDFWKQVRKNVHGSAKVNLNTGWLKNFEITIPSLKEQNKIIEIMDKLEVMTNDISEGLPAEIEARQKQYEYYRDKLLTFKELVNEG